MYNLYDLYDLAHVAGWESYHLHELPVYYNFPELDLCYIQILHSVSLWQVR